MDNLSISRFSKDAFYNKPLLETDNFKVIPSLGGFIRGWLLIIPKEFHLSFGYLDRKKIDEFEKLHGLVIDLLEKTYENKVVCFENGTSSNGSELGCGVDYAHMHYVPTNINLLDKINDHYSGGISWKNIEDLIPLSEKINKKINYLFIENHNRLRYLAEIQEPYSQLIRKILAKEHGFDNLSDWKQHFFEETIKETCEDIFNNPKLIHNQTLTAKYF